MFRIDTPTAVGALPAPLAVGTPGYFNHAPAGSGFTPTVLTSDWANTIQEELAAVVEGAALALDKTNHAQLLAAITSLISTAGSAGSIKPLGLTTAMTPAHTTTQVTIAAGTCRDSTNSAQITLAAPIIKDLTAVWAAGGGNGGRDLAAALANGQTYHLFVIQNPTTVVVDALFSQSPTAPTLPAGFTKFRWVGVVLLAAAATTIIPFVQKGDDFMFTLPAVDYAAQANGAGVPTLRTVTVPNGIKCFAYFHFQSSGTSDNNFYYSGVFDPDDGVPGAWGIPTQRAQVRRISTNSTGGVPYSYTTIEFPEWTNSSKQVYTFSSDAADTIVLKTRGFRVDRSKFVPV